MRDRDRLRRALEDIETVVHAAALKQVPATEYNPMEFINTNVLGAENVVQACLDTDVKRLVALSTVKAAAPINLYGDTKLCTDKRFIAANNIKDARDLRFFEYWCVPLDVREFLRRDRKNAWISWQSHAIWNVCEDYLCTEF